MVWLARGGRTERLFRWLTHTRAIDDGGLIGADGAARGSAEGGREGERMLMFNKLGNKPRPRRMPLRRHWPCAEGPIGKTERTTDVKREYFDGIRVGPAAWLLRAAVPPSTHSEVKVAAIYRITREVHGHDSITCFLTNRSSTPVYISGKVFCSWEIQGEKADPTPNGGGEFSMNIRSSLPTYYCLNPLPRSATDYAKWDGSLELNGLLPLTANSQLHRSSNSIEINHQRASSNWK